VKRQAKRSKRALILFIVLTALVLAQAVWWTVFMAQLVDEKVEIAEELDAGAEYIEDVQKQEYRRQIMVGLEGVFFLVAILVGAWLIYRSLVRAEDVKFQQENFLMSVTHELKTPLASLQLYLDSLGSDKVPPEKKAAIVPRMKQDVHRLEQMVQNVLDAGRFERSGYEPQMARFDFSALVGRELERVEQSAWSRQVKINGSLANEIFVYGDEVGLMRVIDAVLTNAIKYSTDDPAQIDVSLERESKGCLWTVVDHGVGLEYHHQDRVFERFFRIESEATAGIAGSGLGLYLARELVLAHGGRIWAESEGLGQGTTIKISLKTDEK